MKTRKGSPISSEPSVRFISECPECNEVNELYLPNSFIGDETTPTITQVCDTCEVVYKTEFLLI